MSVRLSSPQYQMLLRAHGLIPMDLSLDCFGLDGDTLGMVGGYPAIASLA